VIGLDHVALNADVIACDMAATPLADQTLDCGVFSLSLMGANWEDYLKEAHRGLKPYGYLFVVEPFGKWQDRIHELCTAIETAGFQVVGTPEQRYDFLYLTALRV
jgi:ubiquinone/menaquinone biosynthesis C-methylase UbiE